jgi:hypothetical protein
MADFSVINKLASASSSSALGNAKYQVYRNANADSPFFRWPRELRDEIYGQLALDEPVMCYDIVLEKGKELQKKGSVTQGNGLVCSQFRGEYADAIERRVEALMAGRDASGIGLWMPKGQNNRWSMEPDRVAGVILEYSVKNYAANGTATRNAHALRIVISCHDGKSKVIFAFRFADSEELEHRVFMKSPWDWSHEHENSKCIFPGSTEGLMRQMVEASTSANWTGYLRLYSVWYTYFLRLARGSCRHKRT